MNNLNINFKSPLLWVSVVFIIIGIGYFSGGLYGWSIGAFVIGGVCFYISITRKPHNDAPQDSSTVSFAGRSPKTQGDSPESWSGEKATAGSIEWDLSSKIITKNGKEWFDVSEYNPSPSGFYSLCTGFDAAGTEALALISKSEGLRIRRSEENIAAILASDEGVGYALFDNNSLLIISVSASNIKKLADDTASVEGHIMDERGCAIVYCDDDTEKVCVVGYNFSENKVWRKSFKVEYDGSDAVISVGKNKDIIVSYGKVSKRYDFSGNVL